MRRRALPCCARRGQQFLPASAAQCGRPASAGIVHGDYCAQAGQVRHLACEILESSGRGHQYLGAGVAQDVGDLRGLQQRIDGHGHATGTQRAVQRDRLSRTAWAARRRRGRRGRRPSAIRPAAAASIACSEVRVTERPGAVGQRRCRGACSRRRLEHLVEQVQSTQSVLQPIASHKSDAVLLRIAQLSRSGSSGRVSHIPARGGRRTSVCATMSCQPGAMPCQSARGSYWRGWIPIVLRRGQSWSPVQEGNQCSPKP